MIALTIIGKQAASASASALRQKEHSAVARISDTVAPGPLGA